MLTTLLATCILAQPQPVPARIVILQTPGEADPRLQYRVNSEKLSSPQMSPKHNWQFDYLCASYGRVQGPPEPFRLKFRVFSQYRKGANDPGERATRMLIRLWDFNVQRLKLDHADQYEGIVDAYLCFGGEAGGEQLFDTEQRGGRTVHVNTMYLYDVSNLSESLEFARELAHEYGHASLPPIGRFNEPEYWANGHLGERLYLTWAYRALKSGHLKPEDFGGSTPEQLKAYLDVNVTPLVESAFKTGPTPALLKDSSAKGMNHYLGLMLVAERVLPKSVFAQGLKLAPDDSAEGAVKGLKQAVQDSTTYTWDAKEKVGTQVWIPMGSGKVTGAKVVQKRLGWAQVLVMKPLVTISGS